MRAYALAFSAFFMVKKGILECLDAVYLFFFVAYLERIVMMTIYVEYRFNFGGSCK